MGPKMVAPTLLQGLKGKDDDQPMNLVLAYFQKLEKLWHISKRC
jgi:hypothetical protein